MDTRVTEGDGYSTVCTVVSPSITSAYVLIYLLTYYPSNLSYSTHESWTLGPALEGKLQVFLLCWFVPG